MPILKNPKHELSAAKLDEWLSYEPSTGIFRWKKMRFRAHCGSEAGSILTTGYRMVRILGHNVLAHRLAWRVVYGAWPVADLDHIDGNPLNNRIENLREATSSQNLANGCRRASNSSGFKGVSFIPSTRKWRATITKDYKQIWLGTFESAEDAHVAYLKAAAEIFGEFARAA